MAIGVCLWPGVICWGGLCEVCYGAGTAGYRWVPLGTAGYHWVPLGTGTAEYRRVLLGTGTAGYCRVPLGTAGYRWVPLGTTLLYIVTPGCHVAQFLASSPWGECTCFMLQ